MPLAMLVHEVMELADYGQMFSAAKMLDNLAE
jgi:hypothetical protein